MNEEKIKQGLTQLQSGLNILFEDLGLTEEVLDLQTNINKIRHKYNISDETKETKSNPKFVQ